MGRARACTTPPIVTGGNAWAVKFRVVSGDGSDKLGLLVRGDGLRR